MMELQWGGGAEGAARFDVFRREIASVVRERDQGARQATINRRAAAWRKGVGYTFRREEAVSLQD